MSHSIKVPTLPRDTTRVNLTAIHVKEGDYVEHNQVIMDIETNKVILEVAADKAGIVSKITAKVGEDVVSEQELMQFREATAQEVSERQSAKYEQVDQSAHSAANSYGLIFVLLALVILVAIVWFG